MKKGGVRRRRVGSGVDEADEGVVIPAQEKQVICFPISNKLSLTGFPNRRKKRNTGLSFVSDDLIGEEGESSSTFRVTPMSSAKVDSEEEVEGVRLQLHEAALQQHQQRKSKPKVATLDLGKDRPQYSKEDLEDLKRKSMQQRNEEDVVVAGDELDRMEIDGLLEDGGEGEDFELLEKREKMRAERRKWAESDEDGFIPLDEKRVNHGKEEEEGGAGGRFVRDRSDDSDEPIEEYRGRRLAFGKASGADGKNVAGSSRSRMNDSAINDWEMDMIRKGTYGNPELRDVDFLPSSDALQDSAAKDQVRPLRVITNPGKRAVALSSILKHAQSKMNGASDRVRILKNELARIKEQRTESSPELLAQANEHVKKASAKYDFLQQMRDYVLNLVSCLQHAAPKMEELEKKLLEVYAKVAEHSKKMQQGSHYAGVDVAWVDDVDVSTMYQQIWGDVSDSYSDLRKICAYFDSFRFQYGDLYTGAHIDDCLAELLTLFIRSQVALWGGFLDKNARKFTDFPWFQVLVLFGEEGSPKTEERFQKILCDSLVKRVIAMVDHGYDVSNRACTERAVELVQEIARFFASAPPNLLQPLRASIASRVCSALESPFDPNEAGSYLNALRLAECAAAWLNVCEGEAERIRGSILAFFGRHFARRLQADFSSARSAEVSEFLSILGQRKTALRDVNFIGSEFSQAIIQLYSAK